jgi:hypothetical protein
MSQNAAGRQLDYRNDYANLFVALSPCKQRIWRQPPKATHCPDNRQIFQEFWTLCNTTGEQNFKSAGFGGFCTAPAGEMG